MSSSDRILFLTGGRNFKIDGKEVDQIPFRNVISITNSVALEAGGLHNITPSTFTLDSVTDSQDLYVNFQTGRSLHFKIPSKNMLIRVDQRNLNLNKKIISSLITWWKYVDLDGTWNLASSTLLSLDFINCYGYGASAGIINCSDCIPDKDYINEVSHIKIRDLSNATIPAGDLTLSFFQF